MRNKIVVAAVVVALILVGALGCTGASFGSLAIAAELPPGHVLVKWFGTCELSTEQLAEAGVEFVCLYGGDIPTGEVREVEQVDGNITLEPVTRRGVAIEFEDTPSEQTLYQVDSLVPSCIREDALPWSMHVAALKSVAMVSGSPRGTVYRLYKDTIYEVANCRVSQTAYDNYIAGTIKVYNPSYNWQAPENKDCFVMVYFITETPYSNEIQIPVIVDKIIK